MKPTFNFTRRQWLASVFGFLATTISSPMFAQTKIRRIQTQYIAALAAEGCNVRDWRRNLGPLES